MVNKHNHLESNIIDAEKDVKYAYNRWMTAKNENQRFYWQSRYDRSIDAYEYARYQYRMHNNSSYSKYHGLKIS